jgi:hypothetical protein
MTTTTLVASGHTPRYSVGSLNAAEFFCDYVGSDHCHLSRTACGGCNGCRLGGKS